MKSNSRIAIGLIILTIIIIIPVYWFFIRDDSLTRLQKDGVIRIGYAVEAPYAFIKPGGDVSGESPEIAKRVTGKLGISTIEWRLIDFGSLISELESGHIDVIAAGMFITSERASHVSFSEPTFHVLQGLLVSKGNPFDIHSYGQMLKQAGLKVAVLDSSTEENLLRNMGFPNEQLIVVPDALTGRVAVESGFAAGLALSPPSIKWMAKQGQLGKIEIAQPFEQPSPTTQNFSGYGAFAFRKTDTQLLNAWNLELKKFIGSPEHLSLIAEFGLTRAELPGSISTWEIISR